MKTTFMPNDEFMICISDSINRYEHGVAHKMAIIYK